MDVSGADVDAELRIRTNRFRALVPRGWVAHRVPAAAVNEQVDGIRLFYGGRGIWYDASRTRDIVRPGVTVGLLHTGRHYDDDLAEDGIVYHYPITDSPGKDAAEVQATKNAAELGLPVYVVVQRGGLRDVYFSWVAAWDDNVSTPPEN